MTLTQTSKKSAVFQADGKVILSPVLRDLPKICHACTTRKFSVDLPEGINRIDEMRQVCMLIDMPRAFLALGQQKHTSNVVIVDDAMINDNQHFTFPETDALVTKHPGAVLAIQTADCTPIFLVDPDTRVIGLAHAGWRGTYGRIAEKTVASMKQLGAKAENIIAWIGPLACVCCYEVSMELIETFTREFPGVDAEHLHNGRHLNLTSINSVQLARAGLNVENIIDSGVCTIHQNDQFFSYRADNGTSGRIISALGMMED